MLKGVTLKPITGTFVNMLISDTGIVNAGLKEWERDFRMMKAIGMDHLFVIRTEFERNGVRLSAEDPRSTTWPEDECLLDLVFRLGDKYGMTVFLGGPVGIGTLICAFCAGPIMQLAFRTVRFDATGVRHQRLNDSFKVFAAKT